MVKSIKIIAKSENGVLALKKHLDETKKGELRLARALGIRQSAINLDPFTLLVDISPRLQGFLKTRHLVFEVVTALEANGATENKDYTIEVEE